MQDITEIYNRVGRINQAALEDPEGFVAACEESYHRSIYSIADSISAGEGRTVVMLAGPSSSGKTTSAHILRDALAARGVRSHTVSLDDFYFGVSNTPVDENGRQDFESVHALDLDELHRCFACIAKSGECLFPIFDFHTGERSPKGRLIRAASGDVMIVEGLHALNPLVLFAMPADRLVKLYVNVGNRVYDDEGGILLTRKDIRLIRRISRDKIYRNSGIENTLRMWPDVQHGERNYLFPHSGAADYTINSFHPYELCIFKEELLTMVAGLDPKHPQYDYALQAAYGLDRFVSLPHSLVPKTSLMREFIESA